MLQLHMPSGFIVAAQALLQALQEDVHRFLRTSISQTFNTLTAIFFALLHTVEPVTCKCFAVSLVQVMTIQSAVHSWASLRSTW
jgi:hypothetical protein